MRSLPETAAPWDNPAVVLYHGTTSADAGNVLAGIDLTCCDEETDFGRGFYTTTSLQQARAWADYLASGADDQPVVLRFRVPREALASLWTVAFVRGDAEAEDCWRLVTHCRRAGVHRPGDAARPMFDLVAGPVAKAWWAGRRDVHQDDQFSFHTDEAVQLLDQSDKGVEPW